MRLLYSVIIPAYNEEKWLPGTLSALNRAMANIKKPGEVIVVDNNSTDKTSRIAGENGARIVFEPFNQISRARNTGARTASGEYLVFLDADTVPSKRLIERVLNHLESGTCCGGGVLVASKETAQPIVRHILLFWNKLSLTFGLAAGCFIYCLRSGFKEIGGFSEKVYAGEEILLSRRMKAWGKARGMSFQIITDPPVTTSLRKVKWLSLLQIFQLVLLVFCPLALRFRSLCAFWYRRPSDKR